MRHVVACLVVALTLGCGVAQSAANATSLTITVWADGHPGPSKTWTLKCDPPRGTHPQRRAACRALAQAKNPFAPVPENAICTQIYGGPDRATIRGTLDDREVSAELSRENGCEIARWDRLAPVLAIASP